MFATHRLPIVHFVSLAALVFGATSASAVDVDGIVCDSDGEPVSGAIVQLFRDSRRVGRATTDGGGSYSFTNLRVVGGKSMYTILYFSNGNCATVTQLTDRKDQHISVVLISAKETSRQTYLNRLNAIETCMHLYLLIPAEEQSKEIASFLKSDKLKEEMKAAPGRLGTDLSDALVLTIKTGEIERMRGEFRKNAEKNAQRPPPD